MLCFNGNKLALLIPVLCFCKGYLLAISIPMLCFRVQIAKLSRLSFFTGYISAVSIPVLCLLWEQTSFINPSALFFYGLQISFYQSRCFVFYGNKLALSIPLLCFFTGHRLAFINPGALLFYGNKLALLIPMLCFFTGYKLAFINPDALFFFRVTYQLYHSLIYYNFLTKKHLAF